VSSRPSTTGSSGEEAADNGEFASLASAKYLLLTTFTPDGAPVATPVRAVVGGDRAYFRTSMASGASKRLRHTDWVQVARCSVLGFCRYGPTVNATARPLVGEQASQFAEHLARTYPVWLRFLGSLAHRLPGGRPAYYELRPDEAVEEQAAPPIVTARVVRQVPVRLIP